MKQTSLLIFSLFLSIGFLSSAAFADTISLNHSNYVFGDTIIISGKVTYTEGKFIGLQILNPTKSDIVLIDQFFPQKDGSFSKSYKAQGPKWYEDGQYTVKLAYNEKTIEKKFSFKTKDTIEKETNPEKSNQDSQVLDNTNSQPTEDKNDNPKLRVSGFPDPNNAPNYYFERYETEPEYRIWFDEIFPDYSISEIWLFL